VKYIKERIEYWKKEEKKRAVPTLSEQNVLQTSCPLLVNVFGTGRFSQR